MTCVQAKKLKDILEPVSDETIVEINIIDDVMTSSVGEILRVVYILNRVVIYVVGD